MKKLFIVYSNLGVGGIPRKIIDLVNYCKDASPDLSIHILLQKQTDFSLEKTITNSKATVEYYSRIGHYISPYFFIFLILYRLLSYKPNYILTYISAYALPTIFCKLLLFWIPIQLTVDEDHLTSNMIKTMRLPFLQRIGIRSLYQCADKIISPSKAILKDLNDNFSIPRKKILVIPNWTKTPKKLFGGTRLTDIIYLGRLAKTKKLYIIIDVIDLVRKEFPGLNCIFWGEGEQRANLTDKINRLALNKNIRIQPPTLNVGRHLSRSKILLYASGNTEGMPVVFLEAMSYGTIVVSLPFAGIKEIISDQQTGFIVETPEKMARLTAYLLTNDRLCKKVRAAAFRYVKKHHSEKKLKFYAQQII